MKARPTSFGPTSVDRILNRVQQTVPRLTRTSDLLLTGMAALLVLVDVAVWRTDRVVDTGRFATSLAFLVPSLGALAAAAFALRRRNLKVALTALAGTSIVLTFSSWVIGTSLPPSFATLFAVALLITGVLRHEPSGSAVLLTMISASAVAAESIRPMVSAAAYVCILSEAAFGIAVGIGVYLRWSDWRWSVAADAARAEERLEIARELHDMVGHYVTGIVVQAQAARHVAERQPAASAAALERIEIAGNDALVAMRRMVGGLRDTAGSIPHTTWDAIDELVAEVVANGEPVHAAIDPAVRTETALASSVLRIIAESLTNVRRHARDVTRIDVTVARRADRLVVTVLNDGSAVTAHRPDAFGVVGMRERAGSFGGSLFAGPVKDRGWLVRAELALEQTP